VVGSRCSDVTFRIYWRVLNCAFQAHSQFSYKNVHLSVPVLVCLCTCNNLRTTEWILIKL
jgi:hypothetical protein